MQITLRVTGIDEAQRRTQLAKQLVLRYIKRDLDEFGDMTAEEMREGHPPGGPHPPAGQMPVFGQHAYIDQTGMLTASIGFRVDDWSNFKAVVVVFANQWYAQMVEQGTARSRPYPFFWPVFYKNAPLLMAKLAMATQLALAEAATR